MYIYTIIYFKDTKIAGFFQLCVTCRKLNVISV